MVDESEGGRRRRRRSVKHAPAVVSVPVWCVCVGRGRERCVVMCLCPFACESSPKPFDSSLTAAAFPHQARQATHTFNPLPSTHTTTGAMALRRHGRELLRRAARGQQQASAALLSSSSRR